MDIGSYKCPECLVMIEGNAVADPTLPIRIKAHKATHMVPERDLRAALSYLVTNVKSAGTHHPKCVRHPTDPDHCTCGVSASLAFAQLVLDNTQSKGPA